MGSNPTGPVDASVVQWVERHFGKVEVAGSTPAGSSMKQLSYEDFKETMDEYRSKGHSDDWLFVALGFGISDRELTQDEKDWARRLTLSLNVLPVESAGETVAP